MPVESSDEPEAFQQFEHNGWEIVSKGYDEHLSQLTAQTVPDTLDAAAITDGMHVLDVCTGPGMLAAASLERGARVTGLDFSRKVLEIAQRRVPSRMLKKGFPAFFNTPSPAHVRTRLRRIKHLQCLIRGRDVPVPH